MRDLLVFGVVLLGLPMAFRRPFLGLLLFSWLAYMRPQDLCWGFARNMRFSFFAGIAMVIGWWAFEQGRRRFAQWDVRTVLLLVLTALVTLSYVAARYHTELFTTYWIEFVKIIVVALFTTGQVDSRQRFRWLLWTIALCLGFYGFKGGVFGVLSGGAPILRGPGGMMEDNNDFCLALVMNVPLLWYLGLNDRHIPWVRPVTRMAMALTVVTVLLTHSRGGFLALVVTALWIAWRSRQLFRAVLALGACTLLFFAFVPHHVLERLATIKEGAAESSAAARIVAWRTAMRMIADNPVLGVGWRNFQPRYLDYAMVTPDSHAMTYVAHNSYLQIWAESGTPSFVCYLVLLVSVFPACRRVYRMGQLRGDMSWALDYGRMMESTTLAFMIGAVFLSRGHFDLIYHWLALVTALAVIARREFAQQAAAPAAAGGGVAVRWRRARAGGRAQPLWQRS
jgi:probable O-glycosylation ligase (exosortase A-associated)